jgi:hypothetical protein
MPVTPTNHPHYRAPAGTSVVLYACIPPSNGAMSEKVLGILRDFADQRGWSVRSEHVDRCPLGQTDHRPGWHKVVDHVEAGRAQGVVAPAMAMIAYYPAQREQFKTWLAKRGVFLACATPAPVTERQVAR